MKQTSRGTHRNTTATPVTDGGCIGRKMTYGEARTCFFGLIQQYPWPHERALDVLYCESTGKTTASNGSHWGLFQLDRGPYYDAATNIMVAYRDYYAPNGEFYTKWKWSASCWADY